MKRVNVTPAYQARRVTKTNFAVLDDEIENLDVQQYLDMENPSDALCKALEAIVSLVGQNSIEISCASRTMLLKPWMTPAILRPIRARDRLFSRVKQNPGNVYLKANFCAYRNKRKRHTGINSTKGSIKLEQQKTGTTSKMQGTR